MRACVFGFPTTSTDAFGSDVGEDWGADGFGAELPEGFGAGLPEGFGAGAPCGALPGTGQ